jgi:putative hydrolase of the HAD superfamily
MSFDTSELTGGDNPIKAIILDYGDVISLPPDPAVMSSMAAMFGIPVERFRQFYGFFRHDYDRGALEPAEYWNKIAESAGVHLDAERIAHLRKSDVMMWSRLNEPVLRWVDELRGAGYKTAVLSNMHVDMVERVSNDGAWKARFDVLALSSSLGMAKPRAEIFEYCLKKLGVRPSEAMFIDDRDENIEAALRVGIAGLCAPSTEALIDLLDMIGFQPLPEL